jgi:hypothetical protein
LNFLCNDSCPRAYLPYFSNVYCLSAVRQPINRLVVTGIGRGDGAMTVSCFDFCCSQWFVEDERAVGSKLSDTRLGSYNEFY